MKISITWLNDYIKTGVPVDRLIHKLTMAGLEVEKTETVAGDTVLELEITPNRPDCLNMLGMAREVSAILNKTVKKPSLPEIKYPKEKCPVEIVDKEGCTRYIGTVIKDVKVAKAPQAMQQRLAAIGLRPINNIVDITNFCLMETGQPLHAFDYDKLEGGKIIVRRAKKGETIITIDGELRELDPSVLVIADAKRPVAIAGVMGGQETEVTGKTKNILLESAYFDPVLIRRAARKSGLSSDSSYRFERGVDFQMVENGCTRAIALIQELAGGEIEQRQDLCLAKKKKVGKAVTVSLAQINGLLGAALTTTQCKTILKKLEFDVVSKKGQPLPGDRPQILKVTPPTFRNDIHQAVDVVEEVARVVGYDNLPLSLPHITVSNVPAKNTRDLKETLRQALIAQGFCETVTYALTNQAALEKCLLGELKGVRVQNPLNQDQEMMRPAVLPNLLPVAVTNINRGQKDLRLFEIGKVYTDKEEKEVVAILMSGTRGDDWRATQKNVVDFYDIKGVAAALFAKSGVAWSLSSTKCPQTVDVFVGKKQAGKLGHINRKVLQNWDIKQKDLFFAQIDLLAFETNKKVQKYKSPSQHPAISRDISLAVNKEVSFQNVLDLIHNLNPQHLVDVTFKEQYLGEKIANDQRGIIFSLVYQSTKRTLTDDEVSSVHQQICQALVDNLKATIR